MDLSGPITPKPSAQLRAQVAAQLATRQKQLNDEPMVCLRLVQRVPEDDPPFHYDCRAFALGVPVADAGSAQFMIRCTNGVPMVLLGLVCLWLVQGVLKADPPFQVHVCQGVAAGGPV